MSGGFREQHFGPLDKFPEGWSLQRIRAPAPSHHLVARNACDQWQLVVTLSLKPLWLRNGYTVNAIGQLFHSGRCRSYRFTQMAYREKKKLKVPWKFLTFHLEQILAHSSCTRPVSSCKTWNQQERQDMGCYLWMIRNHLCFAGHYDKYRKTWWCISYWTNQNQ